MVPFTVWGAKDSSCRCVQGLQRLRMAAVEMGREDGEGCCVPFQGASAVAVE